jgi:hypothetical protein
LPVHYRPARHAIEFDSSLFDQQKAEIFGKLKNPDRLAFDRFMHTATSGIQSQGK